ncbi:MAG TPA: DUF58 domain-containing protein [Ktedonobacterales bacterium]|jgi:uncharacterized protein (DUF58 family)|nr:DUF58 domain-containing protein [Ktedonobacterales bacterium]
MRPWQLAGLLAILWVLAISIGWQPFWVLSWSLSAALALSLLWLGLSTRGLTFKRSALGGRAQVGERVEERLALENHSWVPKLWVQVSDGSTLPGHHAGYVSSVGPHQRIAWRARTICRRRGRYTLGPVTAATGDPLGLFRRELALAPEHELLVLPPVLPLATFDLYPGAMPGRGRGSQRSLQTTTNVVTVRNYVPGDALTRIHWPTTARLGQFMVKEFDLDPTIDVAILLDLDRDAQVGEGDSSTEEYGVTVAASIAAYLLRQQELAIGITVSGAGDGATLPFDRGERQLDRLLEVLAVAHPRHPIPLGQALALEGARLARNTVLVVITPSTDLDWPEGLHHLQRRGVRPLAILLDPHSFDERTGGNSRVQDALTATGVPYIPIQRGDPLVHVLEQGPR